MLQLLKHICPPRTRDVSPAKMSYKTRSTYARSTYHTQLAKMIFDEMLDLNSCCCSCYQVFFLIFLMFMVYLYSSIIARVSGREPYDRHDILIWLVSWVGDLYCTDPLLHRIAAGYDLSLIDVDMSEVYIVCIRTGRLWKISCTTDRGLVGFRGVHGLFFYCCIVTMVLCFRCTGEVELLNSSWYIRKGLFVHAEQWSGRHTKTQTWRNTNQAPINSTTSFNTRLSERDLDCYVCTLRFVQHFDDSQHKPPDTSILDAVCTR